MRLDLITYSEVGGKEDDNALGEVGQTIWGFADSGKEFGYYFMRRGIERL